MGGTRTPNRLVREYKSYDLLSARIKEVLDTPAPFLEWLNGPEVDREDFFSYIHDPAIAARLRTEPLFRCALNRYVRWCVEKKGAIHDKTNELGSAVYYRSRYNYWLFLPQWIQRAALEDSRHPTRHVTELIEKLSRKG